mgnify:CR=1 FL=1
MEILKMAIEAEPNTYEAHRRDVYNAKIQMIKECELLNKILVIARDNSLILHFDQNGFYLFCSEKCLSGYYHIEINSLQNLDSDNLKTLVSETMDILLSRIDCVISDSLTIASYLLINNLN